MVENIGNLAYSPQEAGRLSVDLVKDLSKNKGKGIITNVPRIDKVYVPDRSGELISILGRPGNGKTQWLNHMSKQAIKTI